MVGDNMKYRDFREELMTISFKEVSAPESIFAKDDILEINKKSYEDTIKIIRDFNTANQEKLEPGLRSKISTFLKIPGLHIKILEDKIRKSLREKINQVI